MKINRRERGQALILIVFGIIVLIGMTGLAVDGGMAYSDRRNAQNAADAAALAAGLARGRQQNVNSTALGTAFTNGYNNDGTHNAITVTVVDSPSGACPTGSTGKDITVQIVSHVNTMFAPVLGIRQLTNTTQATTRSCGTFMAPMFNGNAIVALAPTGTAYDAGGHPTWKISGGGIFANSSDSADASCWGSSTVKTPSVTVVGGKSGGSCWNITGSTTSGVEQVKWSDYQNLVPDPPFCDGTAYLGADGLIHEQTGKEGRGSKVSSWNAFSGQYAPGVFCITSSGDGNIHSSITGVGVTFYFTSATYSVKFNGGGGVAGSAPTSGPYKGVFMYLAPQVDGSDNLISTQSLELRGNGSGSIVGSVLAPSAAIDMRGNSGTAGINTQVVGYTVTSGGTADIIDNFGANDNYETQQPVILSLIK